MHLRRTLAWLIAVGCLAASAEGQKSFWNSNQAYLGQARPSDTPQIFAPGLLADPGTIVMDRIAFSRDGAPWQQQRSSTSGSTAISGTDRRC
jgi:hypothetical protein